MTKRDFDLIARVLNDAHDIHGNVSEATLRGIVTEIADRFANELHKTNPRFDVARFLDACGVTP